MRFLPITIESSPQELGRLGGEAFVDHVLFLVVFLANTYDDCLQEVEPEVVSVIIMTCTRI